MNIINIITNYNYGIKVMNIMRMGKRVNPLVAMLGTTDFESVVAVPMMVTKAFSERVLMLCIALTGYPKSSNSDAIGRINRNERKSYE